MRTSASRDMTDWRPLYQHKPATGTRRTRRARLLMARMTGQTHAYERRKIEARKVAIRRTIDAQHV